MDASPENQQNVNCDKSLCTLYSVEIEDVVCVSVCMCLCLFLCVLCVLQIHVHTCISWYHLNLWFGITMFKKRSI